VDPAVIQGFSQAGAPAAGLTDLSPTGVFDQGLALANKVLNATSHRRSVRERRRRHRRFEALDAAGAPGATVVYLG